MPITYNNTLALANFSAYSLAKDGTYLYVGGNDTTVNKDLTMVAVDKASFLEHNRVSDTYLETYVSGYNSAIYNAQYPNGTNLSGPTLFLSGESDTNTLVSLYTITAGNIVKPIGSGANTLLKQTPYAGTSQVASLTRSVGFAYDDFLLVANAYTSVDEYGCVLLTQTAVSDTLVGVYDISRTDGYYFYAASSSASGSNITVLDINSSGDLVVKSSIALNGVKDISPCRFSSSDYARVACTDTEARLYISSDAINWTLADTKPGSYTRAKPFTLSTWPDSVFFALTGDTELTVYRTDKYYGLTFTPTKSLISVDTLVLSPSASTWDTHEVEVETDGTMYVVSGDSGVDKYTITPSQLTLSITNQPVSVIATHGDEISYSVSAQGDGITHAWYEFDGISSSAIPGAYQSTYTTTAYYGRDGHQFFCVVRDTRGNSIVSAYASLSTSMPYGQVSVSVQDPTVVSNKLPALSTVLIRAIPLDVIVRT